VLKDKMGQQVGLATLTEGPSGVRIEVAGVGLPPGPKGIHIHAVGKCEPPEFTSAGAHFNPGGRKHGRLNPDGSHAGDLPNLLVTPIGAVGLDVTTKAVTLRAEGAGSLFGPAGTSLVIHAQPDDERTDPTGNSGGRIACGVITRS
jgi:Cu-Zn family superoxide dismutase